MIQKIKHLIMAISLLSLFAAPVLAPVTASAMPRTAYADTSAQTDFNKSLCGGSNLQLTPQELSQCTDNGTGGVSDKVKKLLNILSALVGIVAVVMIIYAGFRYVSSAGSESGVKTAKNAIIYAIIGLVIVALAQVIVHFVISNVTS